MSKNLVVTISREHGSSGRRIGKMLAEKLEISYYNKEILKFASEDSGISQEIFEKYEEKNSLLYKIAKKVYTGEVIPPSSDDFMSEDNLFNYQAKVVKELAQKESYVLIGQCGGFVLEGLADVDVIKVFITAKREDRIKTLEERFHLSVKEIERLMDKTDSQRAGYFRYHTGSKWHDIRNYDLCINTSDYSIDQSVELIKKFIQIRKNLK